MLVQKYRSIYVILPESLRLEARCVPLGLGSIQTGLTGLTGLGSIQTGLNPLSYRTQSSHPAGSQPGGVDTLHCNCTVYTVTVLYTL